MFAVLSQAIFLTRLIFIVQNYFPYLFLLIKWLTVLFYSYAKLQIIRFIKFCMLTEPSCYCFGALYCSFGFNCVYLIGVSGVWLKTHK